MPQPQPNKDSKLILTPPKHDTISPMCHNCKCRPRVILLMLNTFYYHHPFTGHNTTSSHKEAEPLSQKANPTSSKTSPGSPKEAPQSTQPYQCCIQAQLYSSIATKCLQYWMHHIPAQRKHHHILQSQCITNTNTVRQQLCGPLALFLSISDCDQSFRSAHLISCNQSDSTK